MRNIKMNDEALVEVYSDFKVIQKVTLWLQKLNKLFFNRNCITKSSVSVNPNTKEYQNVFLEQQVKFLDFYIESHAWRVTLTNKGIDYVNQHKMNLVSYVRKYRELYPDKTETVIELSKYNRRVVVDSEYNVEVIILEGEENKNENIENEMSL